MSKMKVQFHLITFFLFFFIFFFCGLVCKVGAATVEEKCSNDLTKVFSCLDYAKGTAKTPTKDCCTSVKEIRDNNPVCLCYFIQQTHNGSQQIKDLGIQESRLLQLPTACSLKNASISNCPSLLGLSPSSPDAAIFTNASSSATPTPTTGTPTPTTGTSSSNETAKGVRIGSGLGPNSAGLMATAITIFFLFAFPVGSGSGSGSGSAATFDTRG